MVAIVVGMLIIGLTMEEIVQTATLLMLTVWRILPAVNRCLNSSVVIRTHRPLANEYFDICDNFQLEGVMALPEPDPDFSFTSELSLKDVSFRYPGVTFDAISNITLSVKKGEKVGLVGASGSGKSTIALILSGLVLPIRGEFWVDGKPLTSAGREAYFRILGFVPQNPLILDGTLAENVALSEIDSAIDTVRVHQALKSAAVDFVDQEPRGLNMPLIGEYQNLSGGQIQRVAIARALYSQPQIIVFDEATSALDQTSENLIRQNFLQSGLEVTTIIIAHRLTSVEFCDTIYWIEEGRIVSSGPPSYIIPLYIQNLALKDSHGDTVNEELK
jgi:ABC-type multidrug transport system fused ATPase/permease subunit